MLDAYRQMQREAVEELEKRYRNLHETEERPENAWKVVNVDGEERYVRSAIPFVGKEYFSNPNGYRVLLYASAENLSGYADGIEELSEEYRVHRCRQSFEASVAAGEFFPSVHIQPINDGGLLVVAYQILKRIMGEAFETIYGNMQPAEFLEHICCSNYGKFTLHVGDGKTNYDYASDKNVLKYCHEYIKADIDVLKPDIIIMPKSMYEGADQKQELLDPLYPDILVFPVYQINARVVNCVIHRNLNKNKDLPPNYKYAEVDTDLLTKNERLWHENIKKIKQDNFKSIYAYVEDVVSNKTRR